MKNGIFEINKFLKMLQRHVMWLFVKLKDICISFMENNRKRKVFEKF